MSASESKPIVLPNVECAFVIVIVVVYDSACVCVCVCTIACSFCRILLFIRYAVLQKAVFVRIFAIVSVCLLCNALLLIVPPFDCCFEILTKDRK